jgi:ADP-heptose:LPS heptosyltransferase
MAAEPNEKPPPKALVIRLSSLGDVVLATAALGPLHGAGFRLSVVTKAPFAPLLEHHPFVGEIFRWNKTPGERAARREFFRWYESQNFDLVLDLQNSWRTWLWRRRLRKKAPVFVAKKERGREWLILYFRLGRWLAFGRGGRARKFRRLAVDALSSLGVFAPAPGGGLTQVCVREEEKEAVRELLPPGEFAAFFPGSAWKGKEWPYFPELAKVVARKIPVVALGSEKDHACDRIVLSAGQHTGSVSLRGKTDLRQSMAVLAHARWVVGNDTGMLHVAEALGKDVAMVEGPTHERMGFSPYRKGSLLLGLDLFCRPCSKSGRICWRGTRKCLRGLSVQAVVAKLRAWGLPC